MLRCSIFITVTMNAIYIFSQLFNCNLLSIICEQCLMFERFQTRIGILLFFIFFFVFLVLSIKLLKRIAFRYTNLLKTPDIRIVIVFLHIVGSIIFAFYLLSIFFKLSFFEGAYFIDHEWMLPLIALFLFYAIVFFIGLGLLVQDGIVKDVS